MHTVLTTLVGLLLMGSVIVIARCIDLSSRTTLILFAVVWFIASVGHGVVGVSTGQSVSTEALIWLVVFGMPMGTLLRVYRDG
ncbi:MAG: hypothetical protein JWQ69_4048 [Pseudomonas sp.]|nr:hypothetical protein [Pseudomonas sp.]